MNTTDFLNHLIGSWELTGQMGEIPLRQYVEAKWELGGLFVQMDFKSTLPVPDGGKLYEALYLIGYDEKNECFVLHLFDTFGVTRDHVVGVGKREGDTIPFVFNYSTGPFTNLFTWDAQKQTWRMEQSYEESGVKKIFATKQMTRTR